MQRTHKATIGKATIGKATIGKATIGKATIGKATIGKVSLALASLTLLGLAPSRPAQAQGFSVNATDSPVYQYFNDTEAGWL